MGCLYLAIPDCFILYTGKNILLLILDTHHSKREYQIQNQCRRNLHSVSHPNILECVRLYRQFYTRKKINKLFLFNI